MAPGLWFRGLHTEREAKVKEVYFIAVQIASRRGQDAGGSPGSKPETRRPALYTSTWLQGRGVSPADS